MKNILILILLLLCGFFAYKLATMPKADPGTVKIAKTGRDLVDIDVENINKKVGENGIERALFNDEQQVIGSTDDLDDSSRTEVDSIREILNIERKQWAVYMRIVSQRYDSLLKATNSGDTLFSYSDPYASISFNRPNETFSLRYDAEVNIAEYWKRKWFLAPKKRYVELWLSDPRATINGVKRFRVEPKPDNFSLKVKGIGDFNGKHQEVYVGGGIEIETRRFEYQGSYLYDFNSNKWYPSFKLGFKLLEF